MRRWEGTTKGDFQAIDRISRFLDEVDAGFRRIQNGQLPSAGGTTINNTIAGVTSHHQLLDLTNFDDHPQYVVGGQSTPLIGHGRVLGQSIYGGSTTNPNLSGVPLALHSLVGASATDHASLTLANNTATLRAHTASILEPTESQGIVLQGGAGKMDIDMVGHLIIANQGGSLGYFQNNNTSGPTNLTLLDIVGNPSQVTSGMVTIRYAAGGTPNANMTEWYKSGSSIGTPDLWVDSSAVLHGAVSISGSGALTVLDSLFTIQDDGNTTRQAKFQLSSITAGNTRTMTVPDASGILAYRDADNAFSVGQTINGNTVVGPNTGGAGSAHTLTVYFDPSDGSGGLKLTDASSGLVASFDTTQMISGNAPLTIPDLGGLLVTDSAIQSLFNKKLSNIGSNIIECSSGATSTLFQDATNASQGFKLVLTTLSAVRNITYGIDQASTWCGRIGTASATGQTAGIGPNTIATPTTAEQYTVGIYVKVNSATTGRVQVAVNWNDGAAQTRANVVDTGTTSAAGEADGAAFIRSAAANAVTYTTTVTGTINYDIYAKVVFA